jgi:hypothetical protein
MSIRASVKSGRKTELDKMRDLVDDPSLSAPSVYVLFRSAALGTRSAVSRGLHDAWVLDYRKMAAVAVGDRVDPRYEGWADGDRAHFYDLETLQEEGVVLDRIEPPYFERLRSQALSGQQTSIADY